MPTSLVRARKKKKKMIAYNPAGVRIICANQLRVVFERSENQLRAHIWISSLLANNGNINNALLMQRRKNIRTFRIGKGR